MTRDDHHEIVIDREGVWHFRGTEMKRKDIVQYLYKYLQRDLNGDYSIEIEDDRCGVRVEDAPYVIRGVFISVSDNSKRPTLDVSLNDGSSERISIDTPLRIGADNVLYCLVKNGQHEARFSRPAYYQFCEYIDYDARSGEYRLILNHISYPLVWTNESRRQHSPEERRASQT